MSSQREFLLLVAIQTLALFATSMPARGAQVDRVVVVQNENSPISKAIAKDYVRRRGMRNIVSIKCEDSALDPLFETIDFTTYQRDIEKPLRAFLASHAGIDFIV